MWPVQPRRSDGVPMSGYWIDWLSLLTRCVHLIAGIAWIGSSFYFVWLDNHLAPPADPGDARSGVGGELWSVHGGGFYHAQKYRVFITRTSRFRCSSRC